MINTEFAKGRNIDEIIKMVRRKTVETAYNVGPDWKALVGGFISLTEILSVLYYQIMNINKNDLKVKNRD